MIFLKLFSNYFKSILLFYKKDSIENKLKKLHNSHLGEECYIFGDGISIKYFDISLFNDKPSIASNNFIFHKDFDKLNMKYYSMYEPYWFLPIFVSGFKGIKFIKNQIQKNQIQKFNSNPNITFFTDISNSTRLKGDNILYLENNLFKKYLPFKLNKTDCLKGSLRVEISLAIFLGFKRAHLIGHDYTHKEFIPSHFYEKGKGVKKRDTNWNKEFFNLIKDNIDLTTVTLGGGSDLLNSISYEELTNDISYYKENFEIVEKQNLQILSSWPWYNI